MTIIIDIVLWCFDFVTGDFNKGGASTGDPIVPVFVKLNGSFSDLLDSFDESILVSIRVVCDDP